VEHDRQRSIACNLTAQDDGPSLPLPLAGLMQQIFHRWRDMRRGVSERPFNRIMLDNVKPPLRKFWSEFHRELFPLGKANAIHRWQPPRSCDKRPGWVSRRQPRDE